MFSKPLPSKGSLWRQVLEEYSRHDIVENEKVKILIAEKCARKMGLYEELEARKDERGLPRNQLAYNIGFYELPYLRKNGLIEYVKPRGCGRITAKGKQLLAKNTAAA